MSTPAAPNDRNRRPAPGWRPSRMALLVAGIAFVIGLALFLLIWLRERNDGFYRAPGVVTAEPGQVFEPLPAPLPAGEERGNASGMGERQAQEAQSAPPPRPAPAAPAPPFPPAAVPGPPRVAMAPADIPVPIQSPAPRYPPEALRRGESGDVLLRVHVGPDGTPVAVDLVRSSHSRALDRAASDAVKRWRFRPAQRDGQPVSGVVQIPISFSADR